MYRVTTQLFQEPPPRAVRRRPDKDLCRLFSFPEPLKINRGGNVYGWLVNPTALWGLLLRPPGWFSRQEAAGRGCPIWGTGRLKARVGENFRPNSSGGFAYHNGVVTAERPHRLRKRTSSSHRGVSSRKSASRGRTRLGGRGLCL